MAQPLAVSFFPSPRNNAVSNVLQNEASLSIRLFWSELPVNETNVTNIRSQVNHLISSSAQSSSNQLVAHSLTPAGTESVEWLSTFSSSTKASDTDFLLLGQMKQWAGFGRADSAVSSLYAQEEKEGLIELSKHSLALLSHTLEVDVAAKEWRLDQKTLKNLSQLASQRQGLRNDGSRHDSAIASWFSNELGLIEIAESYQPVSLEPVEENVAQVVLKLDSIMGLHRIVESLEVVQEPNSWLSMNETRSSDSLNADLAFESMSDELRASWTAGETEANLDAEESNSVNSSFFLTTLLTLFSFQRITKKRKTNEVQ